jgi:Helix-turn-helix domain
MEKVPSRRHECGAGPFSDLRVPKGKVIAAAMLVPHVVQTSDLLNAAHGHPGGALHIVPDTWVTIFASFAGREVWMPWKESSVMEERLRFVVRLLDGEPMTDVCLEFGISRKTGYKFFSRYLEHGYVALSDRSRRPVRYANRLPQQVTFLALVAEEELEPPTHGL